MRSRLGAAVVVLLSLTASAAARPKLLVIDQQVDLGTLTPQGLIPYNTIYLNRCAGGCTVTIGNTANSINNTWPINGTLGDTRTLSAFPWGDDVWQQVTSCVKDVFEPYNVTITDVNPGSANHFEIMVAGLPTEVGMPANVGGVAPGSASSFCTSYLNNALVFDFARVWGTATTCNANCVEDICATAAQEIGHTWNRMDHVAEAKDPMTYFPFAGRKYFQKAAVQCGSDCTQGMAGQLVCSGANNQIHTCKCGSPTQNSHEIVTSLFGAGTGAPPTVTINRPRANSTVYGGFVIDAEAMDNSGQVTNVEILVDGQMVAALTKGPYVVNAPETLASGPHKVEVIAYDPHGFVGKATADVAIGPPCEDSSDCTTEGDACVGGRCVPGSGVDGGLGTTCAMNDDCYSGKCASDGSTMYCVESCVVGDCPGGYGCLDTGGGGGVCWPGFDDGSGGGCGCQSNHGGPLGMMVLIGWLVLTCRRRRVHS